MSDKSNEEGLTNGVNPEFDVDKITKRTVGETDQLTDPNRTGNLIKTLLDRFDFNKRKKTRVL